MIYLYFTTELNGCYILCCGKVISSLVIRNEIHKSAQVTPSLFKGETSKVLTKNTLYYSRYSILGAVVGLIIGTSGLSSYTVNSILIIYSLLSVPFLAYIAIKLGRYEKYLVTSRGLTNIKTYDDVKLDLIPKIKIGGTISNAFKSIKSFFRILFNLRSFIVSEVKAYKNDHMMRKMFKLRVLRKNVSIFIYAMTASMFTVISGDFNEVYGLANIMTAYFLLSSLANESLKKIDEKYTLYGMMKFTVISKITVAFLTSFIFLFFYNGCRIGWILNSLVDRVLPGLRGYPNQVGGSIH